MSRASEHTSLLPLSGLLLALLMIASLLGLQGAIDRALTFQVSPPSRLTAPLNQTLTAPPLIARQPVERAAEAASAEASPAGPMRRPIGAVANITVPSSPAPNTEDGVSPVPLVEPSMGKLSTETPEEIVTMSLFKPKEVHSAKRLTTKSKWGKPGGAQLVQSTSETLAHGKTVKPARTNGKARNSGR